MGKLHASDAANYAKGVKTFEKKGFDALLRTISEAKKSDYNDIVAKINSWSAGTTVIIKHIL